MNKTITCTIDGIETEGLATEIIHRHHCMYRVNFDNGYENIFFTDVETGNWLEEDLGFTSLAAEVGMQVNGSIRNLFHVPKQLTWHHEFENERPLCFGFIHIMNGNQHFYQVYNANRKYLYTLVEMENDEWHILGCSLAISNYYLDTTFAKQVTAILPRYTSKAR